MVTDKAQLEPAWRDPEGARQALWTYGSLWDWPACQLGGISLKGGSEQWSDQLQHVVPLYLHLMWCHVEELGEQSPQEPIHRSNGAQTPRTSEGENKVPVIPWKESTGMLDPGVYSAVVSEITEVEGQFGPQLQFQFVILDGDGAKTDGQIRGWCSAKWGTKTKLLDWSRALLKSKCPAEKSPIDTDLLLGRKCDLLVESKLRANGEQGSTLAALYPYRTMSRDEDEDEPKPKIPAEVAVF